MSQQQQRGSSSLVVVMTLFALGLFALSALQRQLDNIHQITIEEQQHLRAYQQAASSLNWGGSQRWVLTEPGQAGSAWQCMAHQEYGLTACIKPSSLADSFILRGENRPVGQNSPLMLYQRVRMDAVAGSENRYQLAKVPNGWLDFCPDKDEQFCIY
ncbi:YgdB family protein [Yersinia pekkanenii]|uniref:Membrane protein n=1 Tax=Yersinia pekkanenii TaxID=1288385 RepID=A0A0T9P9U4_9GAMM|nr:YgdB family protein [Yersinia pekkanenii]CNH51045.1 membrane protein [Yersinia pekkanenii]CRY67860.1 membrane protein [Yersinia pekkanenii]